MYYEGYSRLTVCVPSPYISLVSLACLFQSVYVESGARTCNSFAMSLIFLMPYAFFLININNGVGKNHKHNNWMMSGTLDYTVFFNFLSPLVGEDR